MLEALKARTAQSHHPFSVRAREVTGQRPVAHGAQQCNGLLASPPLVERVLEDPTMGYDAEAVACVAVTVPLEAILPVTTTVSPGWTSVAALRVTVESSVVLTLTVVPSLVVT
jgi:hypothetical protein